MNKSLFTCNSDNWSTPNNIYNYFMNRGYFDPCPLNSTFDGLSIEWKNNNFVNPPYSKLSKWVDKAIIEAYKGHTSWLLIPARTDTKNFSKLWDYGCHFIFLRGRLKFGNSISSAPFPSMLVFVGKLEKGSYCSNCTLKDYFEHYAG